MVLSPDSWPAPSSCSTRTIESFTPSSYPRLLPSPTTAEPSESSAGMSIGGPRAADVDKRFMPRRLELFLSHGPEDREFVEELMLLLAGTVRLERDEVGCTAVTEREPLAPRR